MNMHVTKSLSGLVAALLAMVIHVPALVHKSAVVALGFLVLDTVTGYICAAFDRNWSSQIMRMKMVAKISQYALLLGSCAGAAILADNWSFVVAGWWAIISIEMHSNIENLVKLQSFGVNLGPVAPLLTKLSQFFNTGQVSGIIVPIGVITPGVKIITDKTSLDSASVKGSPNANTQAGILGPTGEPFSAGAGGTGADRDQNGA